MKIFTAVIPTLSTGDTRINTIIKVPCCSFKFKSISIKKNYLIYLNQKHLFYRLTHFRIKYIILLDYNYWHIKKALWNILKGWIQSKLNLILFPPNSSQTISTLSKPERVTEPALTPFRTRCDAEVTNTRRSGARSVRRCSEFTAGRHDTTAHKQRCRVDSTRAAQSLMEETQRNRWRIERVIRVTKCKEKRTDGQGSIEERKAEERRRWAGKQMEE